MADPDQEKVANLEAYEHLKEGLKRMYPRGQYIAICRGHVAADAGSFKDLLSRLANIGEEPAKALIIQAGVEYPEKLVIFLLSRPS